MRDPARERERKKQWKRDNPEAVKAGKARYREAHREELKAKAAELRAKAKAEKEALIQQMSDVSQAECKILAQERKELTRARNRQRTREHYEANKERLTLRANEYRNSTRAMMHGAPEHCELCDCLLTVGMQSGVKYACWDHDHELEHLDKAVQFRGWLCNTCNTGIGLLEDSAELVAKAAAYLAKHESRRRELLARAA